MVFNHMQVLDVACVTGRVLCLNAIVAQRV